MSPPSPWPKASAAAASTPVIRFALAPPPTTARSVSVSRAVAVARAKASGSSRTAEKSGRDRRVKGRPEVQPGVQIRTSALSKYCSARKTSPGSHAAGASGQRSPSWARSPALSKTTEGIPANAASSTRRLRSTVLPLPLPANTTTCRARSSVESRARGAPSECPNTRELSGDHAWFPFEARSPSFSSFPVCTGSAPAAGGVAPPSEGPGSSKVHPSSNARMGSRELRGLRSRSQARKAPSSVPEDAAASRASSRTATSVRMWNSWGATNVPPARRNSSRRWTPTFPDGGVSSSRRITRRRRERCRSMPDSVIAARKRLL